MGKIAYLVRNVPATVLVKETALGKATESVIVIQDIQEKNASRVLTASMKLSRMKQN